MIGLESDAEVTLVWRQDDGDFDVDAAGLTERSRMKSSSPRGHVFAGASSYALCLLLVLVFSYGSR